MDSVIVERRFTLCSACVSPPVARVSRAYPCTAVILERAALSRAKDLGEATARPASSAGLNARHEHPYSSRNVKRLHLPNRTATRLPAGNRLPGAGDCSRATPLPNASTSIPAVCAASITDRIDFPKNDGTTAPSLTSRITVPFGGSAPPGLAGPAEASASVLVSGSDVVL